jgi:hypothetical protein
MWDQDLFRRQGVRVNPPLHEERSRGARTVLWTFVRGSKIAISVYTFVRRQVLYPRRYRIDYCVSFIVAVVAWGPRLRLVTRTLPSSFASHGAAATRWPGSVKGEASPHRSKSEARPCERHAVSGGRRWCRQRAPRGSRDPSAVPHSVLPRRGRQCVHLVHDVLALAFSQPEKYKWLRVFS